jgi:type IV pilus assembly protein PilC
MILKSGISPTEGISIMLEDAKRESERTILSSLYDTMLQTGILSCAMENTGVFPSYMLSMVKLGEKTGRLDETMTSLSRYYEREAWLSHSLHQAVAYPCMMVVMMLAVIVLLITQVIPIFDQVFQQLGTEMTGFAKALLRLGMFLSSHAAAVIVTVLLLAAGLVYLFKSKSATRLFYRMGGARLLSDKVSAYRFTNGLSLTLQSGLSPEESLHLTAELLADTPYRARVKLCAERVAQGEDLYRSIFAEGLVSGVYARMAAIAARTGVLDEVMAQIADRYEQEIDDRISHLLAAIEPTLVVILSVLVGLILLSVMLPLIHLLAAL